MGGGGHGKCRSYENEVLERLRFCENGGGGRGQNLDPTKIGVQKMKPGSKRGRGGVG